ncbi:hypothetical protein V8C26DRAFT_415524 [Trichoderma gracile]
MYGPCTFPSTWVGSVQGTSGAGWGIPECFTMMEKRRNGPIPALASCEDCHRNVRVQAQRRWDL